MGDFLLVIIELFLARCFRFIIIHAFDRRTDRQTDGQTDGRTDVDSKTVRMLSQSRGKNVTKRRGLRTGVGRYVGALPDRLRKNRTAILNWTRSLSHGQPVQLSQNRRVFVITAPRTSYKSRSAAFWTDCTSMYRLHT